jgi:hypothetical protein
MSDALAKTVLDVLFAECHAGVAACDAGAVAL